MPAVSHGLLPSLSTPASGAATGLPPASSSPTTTMSNSAAGTGLQSTAEPPPSDPFPRCIHGGDVMARCSLLQGMAGSEAATASLAPPSPIRPLRYGLWPAAPPSTSPLHPLRGGRQPPDEARGSAVFG